MQDWLAHIGFDWLDLAALGDQPVQLIRFASIELTGMNLRDSATHSGRLRATWVTRCAALHDWLPRIGFDCLNLPWATSQSSSFDVPARLSQPEWTCATERPTLAGCVRFG